MKTFVETQLEVFWGSFSGIPWGQVLRVSLLLFLALPMLFVLARTARRMVEKRYSAQHAMIASKVIHYGGLALLATMLLHELGFKLAPLLGAAGILGVAVGFASQTSISNIISGLFLIAEKPFVVGDAIQVEGVTGQVLSIDFLSVKIRTFDNTFVRIPNETLIKSQVTTISYFPIRRFDLTVSVAYKEDIARVRTVLLDVAKKHVLALEEPEPLVIFSAFGSSSIDLTFAVWAEKGDWLSLKNTLPEKIKERFDQEGIEIPFPHLSLYTGAMTEPFPVKIVSPS